MRLQTLPPQTAAPTVHATPSWPDGVTFREAIQSPQAVLEDPELRSAQVVPGRFGLPLTYSGRSAVVFRLRTPDGDWALRCFTQPLKGGERRERYRAIAEKLDGASRHFVSFRYIERGVRVGGVWYPVVAMRWAEGETLGRFVEANHDNPAALAALCAALPALLHDLEAAGIAHGDWQHDNLIIADNGRTITLVDYDGMYVPALVGRAALELGHPSFQHPARAAHHYGVGLDRFSCLLLQTALLALVRDPSLWARFNDGESVLFKRGDLAAPDASPVFAAIGDLACRGDAALGACLDALRTACLAGAAGVLLPGDAVLPAANVPQPPPVTAERAADTFWSRRTVPVAAPQPLAAAPGFLARVSSEAAVRAERRHIRAIRNGCAAAATLWLAYLNAQPHVTLPLAILVLLRFLLASPLGVLVLILLESSYRRWPRRKILRALERAIQENRRALYGYNASNGIEISGILEDLNGAYASLKTLDEIPHIDDRDAFITAELRKVPLHHALLAGGDPITLWRLSKNGVRTAADLPARGPVADVWPRAGKALLGWRDELARNAGYQLDAKNAARKRLRQRIPELEQERDERLLRQVALEQERAAFPDTSRKRLWRDFWGLQ